MSQPHPLQAFLSRIPLFATLTSEDLPDILRALRPRSMREGETIFRQDDAGEAAYVVETGAVEIRLGETGELVVARMGPGEVFGELALIDGASRSATAVCVESGTLHRLDKTEFDFLRRNLRPAAYKVLRVLAVTVSERVRETNDHIARALAPDAPVAGAPAAAAAPGDAGGVRGFFTRLAFWSKS
ncbi:cyclic nucleotide-binding domain-containing protein [Myxococcota bacterium]|nr:cyclic nucleotide-binding domain-containing protein [Myxococcota bacterium]